MTSVDGARAGTTRDGLLRRVLPMLLPQLNQLPQEEWEKALGVARTLEFDAIERATILAGIVFTVMALKPDTGVRETGVVLTFAWQYIAAVPVLACFVWPARLRRLRRGLAIHCAHRHSGASTFGPLHRR